nr:Chain B, VGLWKS peptide [synthetic construct]
VGLWKS